MYRVTYKHRLKTGKKTHDFERWLETYWKEQQAWGAQYVRFWRDSLQENNILFCEYRVDDIKCWTEAALNASSQKIISELETITDTKHIFITKETERYPQGCLSYQKSVA